MSQPYRPSNETEGGGFQEYYCDHCERDRVFRETNYDGDPALGCQILADALCYDITDPKFPKEWISDERGSRCTAFTTGPTLPERCPKTPDLFAVLLQQLGSR